MYEAVPAAAAAWRRLFAAVFEETGLDIRVIEHRFPKPIADLWAQPDLCCAFMCGWPFVRAGTLQAIAAPVPSPARYEHLPRYCSEFLVRDSSGWHSLEETFGHRFGWMSADSQSGFNAPRAHLARYVTKERPALFSEVRGPLGSPMRALEALVAGDVDVIALDSFFLDVCRHHEADRLRGTRCVDTTEWAPIPLLVAASGIAVGVIERLRQRLVTLHEEARYRELLADAVLERFVAPDVQAYGRLEEMARFAAEQGYVKIH
jgi:ABC-type phosphate/phosphonate transport system substrate-binding protein